MKDEGCQDDPGVLLLGFGCASASTGASRWPVAEARTHRKRRDRCTTRPCSPMEDVRRLKSKFAKRTWNVSWNQQLHFWRLTSPCRLGAQGMVAASGSEGVRRRRRPQGKEGVAHTWRRPPC